MPAREPAADSTLAALYQAVLAAPDADLPRLVLGRNGEVDITGNHYDDFRQVINMPQG